MVVIVKNYIDQSIMIDDLGIEIENNNQIDLSDLFSFFEIISSNDLKKSINENNLVINNGICDLNIEDAIDYITFRES